MKEIYLNAMMEVIDFEAEDVIATSNGINVDDGDDIIDLPFVPAE